ncbi:uncharacterized protein G2W53_043833 [Senna tora]|uniref:Uncharacterized protein n=1 Tax=Senna tora TaxID=362788 RepID=A0A834SPI2_9FABA|nr:uncharacterized protein G2W53_043833 [Senna tora]
MGTKDVCHKNDHTSIVAHSNKLRKCQRTKADKQERDMEKQPIHLWLESADAS